MAADITLKIALPKIPDIELVALEGLERLAHYLGVSEEKIGEAKILVTEAVINALEHAGGTKPIVRVEFAITREQLTILVRDYGAGFDPTTIVDPKIQEKMGTSHKRGWGMKLMKTLSDGFQIESGRGGTKITLTKKLQ